MKLPKKWGLLFLFLIGIDLALKFYVYSCIPKMSWIYPGYPYGGIGIFKNFFGISFSLNHIENTGAAWGIFSSYPKMLFIIRSIAAFFLGIYLLFINKDRTKSFPLFLIFTGAVGNILDFLFYGHVIDMFHFVFGKYSYPLFNFADAMICIGVFWLFLFSCRKKEKMNEN